MDRLDARNVPVVGVEAQVVHLASHELEGARGLGQIPTRSEQSLGRALRRRQHPEGENPLSDHPIPVFAFHQGFLHCCYNRNPIDWVEQEGMKLTDREKEVLDFFDSVVARPDLQFELEIKLGDMQFLNNFVILHSRTAFENGPGRERHLVRLWLEDPNSKRMGESLLDLYVPGTSRFHARA